MKGDIIPEEVSDGKACPSQPGVQARSSSSAKSASELALELGIRRNQLYKWKDQLGSKGEKAFRGPGRKPATEESEVARLKRELEKVTEERDILKKAAAYFARELP